MIAKNKTNPKSVPLWYSHGCQITAVGNERVTMNNLSAGTQDYIIYYS